MIHRLISHRAIDRRLIEGGKKMSAGRRPQFFRPAVFALLAFALLPVTSFTQSQDTKAITNEESLLNAIHRLSRNGDAEIPALLDGHRDLLTPRLWKMLMGRATMVTSYGGAEQSLRFYGAAVVVAQALGDKKRLGATHYNRGLALSGVGNTREAIRAYTAAKQCFEDAGAQRDLIYLLSDLGTMSFYLEDYKQARDYSEQSIRLAESLKDSAIEAGAWPDEYGVASALSTLGYLSQREGDYSQAIGHLEQALSLYRALNKGKPKFSVYIADTLAALGRTHRAVGENNRALRFLHQALDIAKPLPRRDLEANVLNDLGVLYLEQEDYEKADDHLLQSLKIHQSRNDRAESARLLLNLGVSSQRRGDAEQALDRFRKSLDLATAASNKDVMIAAGEGIGAVYREKRQYDEALNILDRSLTLAKEVDDRVRAAEILWRKSEVFLEMGAYDSAAELAESALKLARELRLPNHSYVSATALGRAHLGQKKADLAFRTLTQAIDEVEAGRFRVAGGEEERQLYFENKVDSYHALIAMLVGQNKPFDALLFAERAKSRVLLDVMSRGDLEIPKVLNASEKEEEQRLNRRIAELNIEMTAERLNRSPNDSRLNQLAAQLDDARLKYAAFRNVILASRPDLKLQLGQLPPLKLNDLNGLTADHKTALLEYVIADDQVYLFVLTKKSQRQNPDVQVHSIPIKRNDLTRRIERIHQMMAERRPGFGPLSREIYDLLIKPAEPQFRGKTTLCIIPDGPLWELPFQALQPREDRYLIEDFAVFHAPSLGVLREVKGRKRSRPTAQPTSLLAFGNPVAGVEIVNDLQDQKSGDRFDPLPEAEAEVKALTESFDPNKSRILIGEDADEQSFKSLAPTYDIIHCATHGVFDNRHPLYSFLLFAKPKDGANDDGLLEAREIMSLKLNADLAVLSACDTARGRIGAGEGVIGLSWAFFAGGCRSTLVSQWKVNSAHTADWMGAFYERLSQTSVGEKETKAGAVRLATIKTMKDKRYEHPFYWASFVLIGDQ
jgi:CHAT domain-containing protein/tetratricopeptide (TPR) repeat protein